MSSDTPGKTSAVLGLNYGMPELFVSTPQDLILP
jgi:hypothetical protein